MEKLFNEKEQKTVFQQNNLYFCTLKLITMIQRIQTLFLVAATILIVVLLLLPIGIIYTNDAMYYYSTFTIKDVSGKMVLSSAYIGISLIVCALISIIAIFMYKNRLKQIRWTTAAMYVYIITIVLMTFIFPEWIFSKALGGGKPQLEYSNQWLLITLMLGTALLLFFAKRFIIKDEQKVRKADRLR
jgi:hypothetical protein